MLRSARHCLTTCLNRCASWPCDTLNWSGKKALWPAEAADLRAAIGEARDRLRDTSLDPVRERFRGLVGASGDLSGKLYRIRQARKPAETVDGRLKTPWPAIEPRPGARIPLGDRR